MDLGVKLGGEDVCAWGWAQGCDLLAVWALGVVAGAVQDWGGYSG